ncbi:hypothetical protein BGZ94_003097, partial [Podila epigama]
MNNDQPSSNNQFRGMDSDSEHDGHDLPELGSPGAQHRHNRQHRTTLSTSSLQLPQPTNHTLLHIPPASQPHPPPAEDSSPFSSVSSSISYLPSPPIPLQTSAALATPSDALAADAASFDQLSEGPYEHLFDEDMNNEQALRRRKRTSFMSDSSSPGLAPMKRSIASRSSTSSIREGVARPGSPPLTSHGNNRSPKIRNRSSVLGTDQAVNTSPGWISGLSEVMANVSSRVVNSRAQEQSPGRTGPIAEQDPDGDLESSDQLQPSQRGVSVADAPASPELPPWVAPSGPQTAPSEHGSTKGLKRSGSKRNSGSRGPGSVQGGTRLSQQGQSLGQAPRGLFQGSMSGSNLGKSAIPERHEGDEESVFAPGGFAHRGTDKMKLEGRSFLIFGPQNPFRLWLASILMS